MADRWIEVRLGGYLKQFGKRHRFLVGSTKEALRAMCKQVEGFGDALAMSEEKGVRFAVFNGKHNIKDVDELSIGTKSVLTILPVYEGSKKAGTFQTILGAVLIAVAAYFTAGFSLGFTAAGVWGAVAVAGASMMLGGIAQLLAPQPSGLKMQEDSENRASYAFGGPVNTTAQGNPIPLFYGEREVGGAIISAGILAEDQA